VKGTTRVARLALPALAAAAALLCLAGGAFARGTADQALAIAVDGPGTVTGTGISCRDGIGDCVELYADGTSVTLTAASDPGAAFAGWGGDCSAATGNTCTLTMSSAAAVTASFTSGGGGGGDNPTLTVIPSGNGKVTGSGIDCGNGATDCSETYATATTGTLTATPSSGATFIGWGGACSGTATTCVVSMSEAKNVTATFSSSSTQYGMSLSVTGSGHVTGAGIDCGNGNTDCSELFAANTTVSLTAIPASGATFAGWGGNCSGSGKVCTLTVSAAKAVTASFAPGTTQKIPTIGPAGSFAARSLGRPIVVRTSAGWAVTLRFHTSRSSTALLRLSRNGRDVNAFTFSPRAGNVRVGPFNVARAGAYVFRLTLSEGRGNTAALIWNLCISPCGGGSFTLTSTSVRRLGAAVVRSGSGMVIKVRFQTDEAGAATVRAFRSGHIVSTGYFTFRRGPVTVDVPIRASGMYSIVMDARNAVGRTFQLRWNVRT
jgi:List-Bact-rpt repeat protein